MIQTDTFLTIGSTHSVCEDYIISGDNPYPYIILSDGCSTSKNTDMGSRILCHLAKQYLLYRKDDYRFPALDYNEMGLWIIHNAELVVRQLGIHRSCLNATLMIAYVYDNRYHIYTYGDGCMALQTKEGNLTITELEFTKNAPYYLSYRIDPEAMDAFHNLKQDLIIKNNINGVQFENKYAYDYKNLFILPCDDYPRILLCSDGFSSFMSHKINPVGTEVVGKEFLAYKSTKGEFLKRRLKRALKNYSKNCIEHFDDLSVGAFIYEE